VVQTGQSLAGRGVEVISGEFTHNLSWKLRRVRGRCQTGSRRLFPPRADKPEKNGDPASRK